MNTIYIDLTNTSKHVEVEKLQMRKDNNGNDLNISKRYSKMYCSSVDREFTFCVCSIGAVPLSFIVCAQINDLILTLFFCLSLFPVHLNVIVIRSILVNEIENR